MVRVSTSAHRYYRIHLQSKAFWLLYMNFWETGLLENDLTTNVLVLWMWEALHTLHGLDRCSDWTDLANLQRHTFPLNCKHRIPAKLDQRPTGVWWMHLLMYKFAEGATGFLSLCLRTGKFSWRKTYFVSPLRFVYLFCIKINCTVFLEIEMVHVKKNSVQEHSLGSSWSICR